LKRLGRAPMPMLDKFNPGQKLNAAFTGAAIVVMLATGSVMQWFGHFPVSWRTGATFVHDVFAFAVFIVVIGHVAFALTHRDAMRSMIKGWVTRAGRLGTRRRGWRSNEGRSPRRWIATPPGA